MTSTHVYYYSSPVPEICPKKSVLKIGPISTRTVSIRHQSSREFFYAYILPVRSLFAFVLCFLRHKIKKNFASPQLRCLDAIFLWQFSRRCRHRRLLKTAHDFARLRTTKHNGRFDSFINTISLHVYRHFIFTGSYSATHGLLLS